MSTSRCSNLCYVPLRTSVINLLKVGIPKLSADSGIKQISSLIEVDSGINCSRSENGAHCGNVYIPLYPTEIAVCYHHKC